MTDNTTKQNSTTQTKSEPAPKASKPAKAPQWMRDIATSSEADAAVAAPTLPNQVVMPDVSEEPPTTKREVEKPHLSKQEVEEYVKEKQVTEQKEKEVLKRLLDNTKQMEEDRLNLEKIENEMQAEEDRVDQLLKSKFG